MRCCALGSSVGFFFFAVFLKNAATTSTAASSRGCGLLLIVARAGYTIQNCNDVL